jgi:hypothetical protein
MLFLRHPLEKYRHGRDKRLSLAQWAAQQILVHFIRDHQQALHSLEVSIVRR